MTLSTNIFILDPVDPVKVFDFVNTYLLKATNPRFEHEHITNYVKGDDGEWTQVPDPEVMSLSNDLGQGFDAWFMSRYRAEGKPLYAEDHYEDWACEGEDPDMHLVYPACFMRLDFDTAYGYSVPGIGGCSDLHARYITALHDWLEPQGIRIKWENEFTGEVFEGLDGLEEFASEGAKARDWFKGILPGIILSAAMEPETKG